MEINGLNDARLPQLGSSTDRDLDAAKGALRRGDVEDTARQFETLFATLLVSELRRAMPEGPFGKGPGADVYEGWFDEHLGRALGEHDALGIAGMVKTSLLRKQAAEQAGAASGPGEIAP